MRGMQVTIIKRIQQTVLILLVIGMSVYFLSSFVPRVRMWRDYFPPVITWNWFSSFPSQNELFSWPSFNQLIRTTPSFERLYDLNFKGKKSIADQDLDRCGMYYGILQYNFSGREDAGLFKGFCHYYQGNQKEAEQDWLTIKTNSPVLFWIYYNLGIISLESQHFDLALGYFEKALLISDKELINYMMFSKLYDQLTSSRIQNESEIANRIRDARLQCVLAQRIIRDRHGRIDEETLKNIKLSVRFL